MSKQVVGLTGASGSLGKRIALLLDQQSDMVIAPFGGDLRSESDLRRWISGNRLDNIILCGGIVPLEQASRQPDDTFEVNSLSNLRIATLMRSLHGQDFRICYSSSSHVYSDANQPISEDSSLQPRSVYASSKLLGERLLQSAAEAFNFGLVILRAFSFYSEDQHESQLYPTLLRRLAKHPNERSPFKLEGWNNVRDFSSADDIASKVVRVAASQHTGIVNVGSGVGMTVGDFASQVYGSALKFRQEDASVKPTMLVADTTRFNRWMGTSS